MTDSAGGEYCLNCGATLSGRFCHECGQKVIDDDSVPSWLSDIFEAITDLESRALRSSLLTLGRPGRVAKEYVEGRRQSYVSPLRLFIVASAIVIPLMVATGWFEKTTAGQYERAELLSVLFPALNLLSPFLAAVVLKLLAPKMPYYHHLVLCFCFGTAIVVLGIPLIIDPYHPISITYQIGLMCGYSFLMIRDFYQYSIAKSVAVAVAFLLLWQTLWQFLILGVIGVVQLV